MTSGKACPGASRRWSDGETSALVGAWGQLYLRRNRGSLRMEDWLAVCRAVNAYRGDLNRTLPQCRTRVCTLKARYKEEVAKARPTSGWRHLAQLRAFLVDSPPGFSAKTPAATVKKMKEDEEEEDEEGEVSGCVGGSAGGREVAANRCHFSSLRDILERSGEPSLAKPPAEVKEEETVKKEEVVGCGCDCELVGGPAAVVTKLAEVYERVEVERLKLKKEMLKVKEEDMEMENVKLGHKKMKADSPEEADGN